MYLLTHKNIFTKLHVLEVYIVIIYYSNISTNKNHKQDHRSTPSVMEQSGCFVTTPRP